MKSVWLFRVTAIVFVLFAAGHTFGFLSFRPDTVEGRAVWDAMNHALLKTGEPYTYGGFYTAFGLSISISMLLQAYLAWHLSGLARTMPQAIGGLGWVFCLSQLGGVIMSWVYFGVPQITLSAAVFICLGWAMLALPRTSPLLNRPAYVSAQPS